MPKNIFLSNYLSPRTKLLREWSVVVIAVVLLAVGEFVNVTDPLRTFGEKWWRFWNARLSSISRSVVQPLKDVQSLSTTQRRVRDLEIRLAQSLAQLGELEQLRQENQALRQMMTLSNRDPARVITAPIVSYGRPLIAAGSDEGVKSGMMVIMQQTLIGIVGEVSQAQATVALLQQDKAPHILAKTETGVTGIVMGNGQRVLMTEVPVEQVVSVGQRVTTQGQEGVAANILIGTVSEIRVEPTAPVKTVVLEQVVSFYEAALIEVR